MEGAFYVQRVSQIDIDGNLIIKRCCKVGKLRIFPRVESGSPYSTSTPTSNIIPIQSILEQ